MTDFEQTVLRRLTSLENEVERLKSEKSLADKALEFERLPGSATVGKDYAAYRFRCSEEAVVRGWCGTLILKKLRISNNPLRWKKKAIDDAFAEYSKTPEEKAQDAIEKANERQKKPRRKSIIKKQLAA